MKVSLLPFCFTYLWYNHISGNLICPWPTYFLLVKQGVSRVVWSKFHELSIVIHIVKAENDNKEICPEYLIQSLSNESGLVNILSNLFFLY